jgi:hypothetical protein
MIDHFFLRLNRSGSPNCRRLPVHISLREINRHIWRGPYFESGSTVNDDLSCPKIGGQYNQHYSKGELNYLFF